MRRAREAAFLGMAILFCFSFCILGAHTVCFAGGIDKEYKAAASAPVSQEASPGKRKSFFGEGKFDSLLSLSGGYDNNVYLDSRRKADGFVQMFFRTTYTSPLGDATKGIFEYSVMNLLYGDESNLNLISNTLRFGIDHAIDKKLNFLADYRFRVVDYFNTGVDDTLEHAVGFRLKHQLPEKMFHSFGYDFMFKDYTERRTRTVGGTPTSKKREDTGNGFDYEIGKYFTKDLVKIKFQYNCNDSNERFLHYYDYDTYAGTFSLTHLFTKKIFGYFAFSRQITDYRDRTITCDNGVRQEDKTYTLTSALYSSLTKQLTLGLTFTYRKNWSNEPTERYQGSVVSLGTHYKF